MKYAGLEIVAWLSPTRRTAAVSVGPYAPGWEPLVRLNDVGAMVREMTAPTRSISVPAGSYLMGAVTEAAETQRSDRSEPAK